ncbi:hypothetical protein GQ457_02G002040 [Hibiscus cannabinus]
MCVYISCITINFHPALPFKTKASGLKFLQAGLKLSSWTYSSIILKLSWLLTEEDSPTPWALTNARLFPACSVLDLVRPFLDLVRPRPCSLSIPPELACNGFRFFIHALIFFFFFFFAIERSLIFSVSDLLLFFVRKEAKIPAGIYSDATI